MKFKLKTFFKLEIAFRKIKKNFSNIPSIRNKIQISNKITKYSTSSLQVLSIRIKKIKGK